MRFGVGEGKFVGDPVAVVYRTLVDMVVVVVGASEGGPKDMCMMTADAAGSVRSASISCRVVGDASRRDEMW